MRPLLAVTYPSELPIVERREEIAAAINDNRVVIVCGETGSGKSTQLPKICLELGRGREKMIAMTQPRRIAARSVAARLAEEIGSPLGQHVGFQVRFASQTSPQTYVKVMTDGILLAESQRDHNFTRYDTIIIDEAHERSLNIDFLLGLARRTLEVRDDLKLIITSATLDAEKFAQYYRSFHGKRFESAESADDRRFLMKVENLRQSAKSADSSHERRLVPAPIITVEGRTFPIEIRHRNYDDDANDSREIDRLLDAVAECQREGGGDILVFLPTERDIADASKALKTFAPASGAEVLPLYARLPIAAQQKIFQTSSRRKIVLATNVAESSLTVPNIRFVIDTGRARISRWSPDSKTQRLPIEAISQSSANQRAGRCGRVRDGICLRLYTEDDFSRRDRYTTPEIQRTNLAAVVLQALSMRLGRLENFPLIDAPSRRAISDGYKTLYEIGAIDKDEKITPLGKTLSRLPLDPRLARVIVAAVQENCLPEILVIVAAMEIQDPRERPPEFAAAADAAHAKFLAPHSDFVGYLRLWQFYTHIKETLSNSQLRKACAQNFLSVNRMREWSDLHVQLMRLVEDEEIARDAKSRIVDAAKLTPQKYAAIHRALLTGFLSRVAERQRDGNGYTSCGGGTFRLWRGSGLVKQAKNYTWILAAESIETSQRFLRTVARIESNWIESLGQHLLKHSVSSPYWDAETGYVHAFEKVTLLSLVITPRRRVNFGKIDPVAARDIFIQDALVSKNFGTLAERSRVIASHVAAIDEAKKVQDKLRRHDIVRGELFWNSFYHERIPQIVCDAASLLRWEKSASEAELKPLMLSLADIVSSDADAACVVKSFPDRIEVASGVAVPVEYAFRPGEQNDGITLVVPEERVKSIDAARLGWLVPGLLEQKIVTLLKGLPKSLRTKLVPIPDTAKRFAASVEFASGTLEVVLARLVSREAGEQVSPRDFQGVEIPDALRTQIRVVAGDGTTRATGRDIVEVREQLGLVEEVVAPETDQRTQTILAFIETNRRKLREQVKWLPIPKRYGVASFADDDLIFLMASRAVGESADDADDRRFLGNKNLCESAKSADSSRVAVAAQELALVVPQLAEKLGSARRAIEENKKSFPEASRDAGEQLARLAHVSFLRDTPWRWLREMPRYLEAIVLRFEKIRSGGVKVDGDFTRELADLRDRYTSRILASRRTGIDESPLADFEWLLEEYRVSCFAQKLGTSVKVSAKRLTKMLEA
ncbi:MAG: ATP-dependent RNA helicase HrpA [Thermoguttaceae bacterium]